MPTTSKGCLNCRKRKIRCDERRPGCKRCETHGVACQGYRYDGALPGSVEIKNQTDVTVLRAKRHQASDGTRNSESPPSVLIQHSAGGQQAENALVCIPSKAFSASKGGAPNTRLHVILRAPSPTSFSSPPLERTWLYNEFIETYVPKLSNSVKDGLAYGEFSFFKALLGLERAEQAGLQQSLDALSCIQFGSLTSDQRFRNQAIRQYSSALNSVAGCIANGVYDDNVLVAVALLANCELYGEIAETGQGWGRHVDGLNRLMALRGPESMKSELSLLLYAHMRHGSLCFAILKREASFMSARGWRDLAFCVPGQNPAITTFYNLAFQMPGLLQRYDEMDRSSPQAVGDIDGILKDSATLEGELTAWFRDWQAAKFHDASPYRLRPVDEFPTFSSLCKDHTLKHAFWFTDFMSSYLCLMYWLVLFTQRSNVQALHRLRYGLDINWYPAPESVVNETEQFDLAVKLCQCMPYFCEPATSSSGITGIFLPMQIASVYFCCRGHWQWLQWIGSVRNSVFVKGLQPPIVDLMPGATGR